MEMAFWSAIKDSKSPRLLQTYVDRFPNGTFSGLARAMIETFSKEQVAVQESSRREGELQKAEEAKLAAAQQQRDAERKALDAKHAAELSKAQEDARKARDALRSAETERNAALKAAEVARKAHEDARKSAETVVASLPNAATADEQVNEAALIRSIQKELRRVGCDPGKEDGTWGSSVRGAIDKFNRHAKASVPNAGPSQDGLAAMIGKTARVCPLECGDGKRAVGERCVTVAAPVPKRSTAETQGTAPKPPSGLLTIERCRELVKKKYVYMYAALEWQTKISACMSSGGTNY
jgi:hypothetical protein